MKIYDDQARLHLAIVQRIKPGQMAIVSTGGMSTVLMECTGKAHNGIWVKDDIGHPFFINWAHVRGIKDKPDDKPKANQPQQATKAIIAVTDPDLLKAVADDIAAINASDIDNDGGPSPFELMRFTVEADRIELPSRNAIYTPAEYAGNFEMESRWNIALHEAGHCVAALLIGGCSGAGLERLGGTWHGIAYDEVPEGESRYKIALAGCAAECLGPWPGGFFFDSADFKHARDELRAKRFPEVEIIGKIADDLATMADEFGERWVNGIRELAEALCRQSWVSGGQVSRILGEGQAVLTKSTRPTTRQQWEDVRRIQPMAKSLTNFDRLQATLDHAGSQIELDAAKGAHAVAVAETRRNHAAVALAAMKGQA